MPDDGPPVDHPAAWWQAPLLFVTVGLVVVLVGAGLVGGYQWLLR